MSHDGAAPPGHRLRVLFVDDEKELADVYATWLEDSYDVETAYSGEGALEYIDEVDIIFLDRRMPGISGDDVLNRIIERDLDCRVAILSAVEPDFEETLGYDKYLTKPTTKEELHETVEELALYLDGLA